MLPVLVAGLLSACGGGQSGTPPLVPTSSGTTVTTPGSAAPAPARLTPADAGGSFTLEQGRSIGLVVPDPLASDALLDGDAVEVVAVVNIDASGYREWEIRALRAGTATVTVPSPGPYSYRFMVVDPAP